MPPKFPTNIDGELQQQLKEAQELIFKTVAKKGISASTQFLLTQFMDNRNPDMIDKMPGMLKRTGMSVEDIEAFTDALRFRANNEWTPQLVQFLHAMSHVEQLPPVKPDQDTTTRPVSDPGQCDAYENSSTSAV
jgi:hypothetical protein